MKDIERPLLIVTSCTRNYGWVTGAFLEGNTRWADYIIIVDQMSSDTTRPLVKEYNEKRGDGIHKAEIVIVDDSDMSYKENTRAKMGFMKGRELAAGRDTIFFALDIDEVMPANWMDTEDGRRILSSKPGAMYQIEWANIQPDGKKCTIRGEEYKIFHDNGMDWQDTGKLQMHTPLLPYSSWDEDPVKVKDFPLIHFGWYFWKWIKYKAIYYQFLDIQQHRSKSAVSVFRMYQRNEDANVVRKLYPIRKEWLLDDLDLIGLVDTKSSPMFVQYIKEIIAKEGLKKFQVIDVWTDELCEEIGAKDPRSLKWKIIHAYMRMTQSYADFFIWRSVDKVLKFFV